MVVTAPSSDSPSSIRALFRQYCKELDESHTLREQIVNASRAVTVRSKKLIFALHRLPIPTASTPPPSASSPPPSVVALTSDLSSITSLIASSVAGLLTPSTGARLHRSFSPCLQEYAEAAAFHHYLLTGSLLAREPLAARLAGACAEAGAAALPLGKEDYALGVADLGGELMRYAVAAAARGGVECAMHARALMGRLADVLEAAGGGGGFAKEMRMKKSVLAQSVAKVERACFDYAVRRAEFPEGEKVAPMRRKAEGEGEVRAKRRRVE